MLLRNALLILFLVPMFISFQIMLALRKRGKVTSSQMKKLLGAILIVYMFLAVATVIAIEWIDYLR
ncbi:MAG: hypothetical protein KDA29_07090 [Phycisphaerales bacterium]|nr:hypothetical protein [Phycisphaerales bacterium]